MMRANVEEIALRAEWVEAQRAVADLRVREPLGPLLMFIRKWLEPPTVEVVGDKFAVLIEKRKYDINRLPKVSRTSILWPRIH